VAVQGEGVLETLGARSCSSPTATCDRTLGLERRFGIPEAEFVGSVFDHVLRRRRGTAGDRHDVPDSPSCSRRPPLGDLLDLRSFTEVCQSFAGALTASA